MSEARRRGASATKGSDAEIEISRAARAIGPCGATRGRTSPALSDRVEPNQSISAPSASATASASNTNAPSAACSERQMRAVRGRKIGLVMQSPLSSLNPAMTIGDQLREAWRAHPGTGGPAWGSLLELLDAVNLPPEAQFLDRYPRQISVGQAQRVLIAMAIVHRPALLVADEPTSALDTVTQAEIVKLFARLNRQLGMSILYISHDLLSVASLCHRIAILRHGRMVESGSTEKIFRDPRDPYTKALLAAIPAVPFLDNLSVESFAR